MFAPSAPCLRRSMASCTVRRSGIRRPRCTGRRDVEATPTSPFKVPEADLQLESQMTQGRRSHYVGDRTFDAWEVRVDQDGLIEELKLQALYDLNRAIQ